MKNFFLFNFLPTSADAGLLVLRVMSGGLMVALHGWGKLISFSSRFDSFPDPLGIGHRASYILVTAGEVVGSIFIVLGLFTRFSALWLSIVMGVAFFAVHDAALSGPRSGEMPLLFMTMFVALLLTGPGRFSIDAKMGARM